MNSLKFEIDNSSVGDLQLRSWHNISTDLARGSFLIYFYKFIDKYQTGWPQSKLSQMRIQNIDGKSCLHLVTSSNVQFFCNLNLLIIFLYIFLLN